MRGFISNNIVLACGNAKALTHYYWKAKSLGYCNYNCRVCLIYPEELEKLIFFKAMKALLWKVSLGSYLSLKHRGYQEVRHKDSNFSYFPCTLWLLSHNKVIKKKKKVACFPLWSWVAHMPSSQVSAEGWGVHSSWLQRVALRHWDLCWCSSVSSLQILIVLGSPGGKEATPSFFHSQDCDS